eukprot:2613669-Rhodomonas_salina.1
MTGGYLGKCWSETISSHIPSRATGTYQVDERESEGREDDQEEERNLDAVVDVNELELLRP